MRGAGPTDPHVPVNLPDFKCHVQGDTLTVTASSVYVFVGPITGGGLRTAADAIVMQLERELAKVGKPVVAP